ncbi:hypothetical protein CYMTET_23164 [Cymbomonas tetramitiformis]|uniref:Uncharacterized protein n=1 Tax=Cymbomonas tetramitiformis TaxID=36881 RepID=A0AAE0L1D5_9CHLO|nr:hypothetical protein CYMTET_23164 [Cymbomonas tetramitiformis]
MDEADGHEGGLMVNPDVSIKSRLMPSFKKSATVMPGMQAPKQQLVQSSPRMEDDPAALASASPVPSDSPLPKLQ